MFCLFTTCMQYPKRPEEGVGSSGIGVQRIVRHCSAGNQTQIIWKSSSALTHWAISPAPRQTFFKAKFSILWIDKLKWIFLIGYYLFLMQTSRDF